MTGHQMKDVRDRHAAAAAVSTKYRNLTINFHIWKLILVQCECKYDINSCTLTQYT